MLIISLTPKGIGILKGGYRPKVNGLQYSRFISSMRAVYHSTAYGLSGMLSNEDGFSGQLDPSQ